VLHPGVVDRAAEDDGDGASAATEHGDLN
jgi:hypothetical protein